MRLVQCPEVYERRDPAPLRLFVAGGISRCRDWQAGLIALLQPTDYCVFNPRRDDFPAGDPEASRRQIHWEHAHLEQADIVGFFFPPETLCPITLFELGKMAMTKRELFVGAHPRYGRRGDVEMQLGLIRPEVRVVDSVEALAAQLIARAAACVNPPTWQTAARG
jgi:hypothetical protein